MPLQAGFRLGPYEIVAPLGAGGMGEVYRAHDTKLNRDVALKILPDSLAADADRIARFRREAQLLAALNHPQIAHIYGIEDSTRTPALVMELVDGPTLADRIAQGAIPIDEALAIAKQIAEALEAAHEQGIIHRDLKPANIKLRADGTVKLLDFGLAKAFDPVAPSGVATMSPTLSIHATQAGVLLGTAAYMSPEQASGKPVDKRTDVWAFGVVLYEMVTGRGLFHGETVSHVVAAVLTEPLDLAPVPERLRPLLSRCLERDPRKRLRDIADAMALVPQTIAAPIARRGTILVAWAAAAVLLVGVAALSTPYFRSTPTPPLMRFEVQAPEASIFNAGPALLMEISPDGRYIAFIATVAGKPTQLFIRALDELEAHAVADVPASHPIWSPDSRFVAFSSGGQLKKVDVRGGPPQPICPFVGGANARVVWGRDAILLSSAATNGVLRVAPDGGTPTQLTTLGPNELGHQALTFLPDGKHYLFSVRDRTSANSAVYVTSLDSKERTSLGFSSDKVELAPPDHLVFARDRALFTQSFNINTFALEGEPVRILENVSKGAYGNAGFSVSQNGLLVFAGGRVNGDAELTWFDRSGKVLNQVGGAPYQGIDLSPDGKRVAVHTHAEGAAGGDISIIDLERNNTTTRLTFDESQDNSSPIWSPDGASIAFSSVRNNRYGIYRKASNGVGTEELLFESETAKVPSSWAPDGKSILLIDYDPKTQGDLWILPLSGDRKPTLYWQSPESDIHAQISPDGHWVAYVSGRSVWVQSYPVPGTKYRVTSESVALPRWRGDGCELFFSSYTTGRIWSVSVSPNGLGLTLGTPQVLFDRRFFSSWHGTATRETNYHTYAVSADGQRFLAPIQPAVDAASRFLTVIVNWPALLKK
jgi:Tol biopolymer transport system component